MSAMLYSMPDPNAASWLLRVRLSRAGGDALAQGLVALNPVPGRAEEPVHVLTLDESVDPARWVMEVFFDHPQSLETATHILKPVQGALLDAPEFDALPAQDWISLSQRDLPGLRVGAVAVVTHATQDSHPNAPIRLTIEAGQAFGTGHHGTTQGCLALMQRLGRRTPVRTVLDVGTGSGVLAMAAVRLWHSVALGTEIDPIAVAVAQENADLNRLPAHRQRGGILHVCANGLRTAAVRERAPFDLVIANILAKPLLELAGSIAAACRPGGHVLLSGLLATQARGIMAAYRGRGLRFLAADRREEWASLLFVKPRSGLPTTPATDLHPAP